jgi:hypothetical protein
MSFKENLKAKIHLDRLLQRAVSSIKEPPGTRWLDKDITREILDRTDFQYRRAGNLDLYVRPPEDEVTEVVVLDNELPIYHTTVDDVTLRKSPHWQEVFSIKNIRKIMNDQDVMVSKGRESLKRLYENAMLQLDLAFTRGDLEDLAQEGRRGLDQGSAEEVRETLNLFFELLGLEQLYLDVLEPDLRFFGRPADGDASAPFDHLLIFNAATLSLGLKKSPFDPADELDRAWALRYAEGLEFADVRGADVFHSLAELVLEQDRYLPRGARELLNELPAH